MKKTIFERYPQLNTLKGLVPDEVLEREIGSRADEYEADVLRAQQSIPTVNLNKVFPSELEKGAIRLENFLGHWGNVTIEELCKICLIVNYIKPRKTLEIGTYNGMSTLQMALNTPGDCITYTLDLPDDVELGLPLSEIDHYVSKHFKQLFDTKTGSYFQGRSDVKIHQLLGDSAVFDYSVIGDKLDIIFIDGAHDYAHVKIDSGNAFNLIAPGGVILWHNLYSVDCPDVTKYLADISASYSIYHLRNTLLAVYWNKI